MATTGLRMLQPLALALLTLVVAVRPASVTHHFEDYEETSESLGEVLATSEAIGKAGADPPTWRASSSAPPRRPCSCEDGQCSCCSGFVLQTLVNFAPRQRGCLNISYDPDDFAFGMALTFNERVLYKNTVSAKNPRPLCVSVPGVRGAKMCVRLSNVYFVGRNVHACVDMEAKWQDTQTFQMSFDCIRIGADGVKVVKPEAGAGLAVGVPVGVTPAPDEYDEIPAEHPPEKPSTVAAVPAPSPAPAPITEEEEANAA